MTKEINQRDVLKTAPVTNDYPGVPEDAAKWSGASVGNHITRRTFLGAAGAVIATAGAVLAQQPTPAPQAPRVKGPRVWLDMDQKELDDAYDQSVYAPNGQQIVGRYATNSEATRDRLGQPRRYAYGPTPVEGLDVYVTKRLNAPINIFIHGGAWRGGFAKDYVTYAITSVTRDSARYS